MRTFRKVVFYTGTSGLIGQVGHVNSQRIHCSFSGDNSLAESNQNSPSVLVVPLCYTGRFRVIKVIYEFLSCRSFFYHRQLTLMIQASIILPWS